MLVQYHGLQFDLPAGWADVTEDLPAHSPPTLAHPDGVGVIQFSIARYSRGERPNTTCEALEKLLVEFFSQQMLEGGQPERIEARVAIVGRIATSEPIAVWYASNGLDLVLITYTSVEPANFTASEELEQARKLVASLSF